jgi:hypothetical protein
LRIEEEIGGQRNIRVIFLLPPAGWKPLQEAPLPIIWVLDVLPKKRQSWTAQNLDSSRARRALVKERLCE